MHCRLIRENLRKRLKESTSIHRVLRILLAVHKKKKKASGVACCRKKGGVPSLCAVGMAQIERAFALGGKFCKAQKIPKAKEKEKKKGRIVPVRGIEPCSVA